MLKIQDFQLMKQKNKKITMLTCYDSTFAKILNETAIDALLVGDSAAMVMHAEKSTLNISTQMIAQHVKAVATATPKKIVIADMPFLSYRKGLKTAMDSVEKLMKAGAHAVKLEGASGHLSIVKHIVESGVPVIGHLGLTPQSIHTLGGYKVQGRKPEEFKKIAQDAKLLQEAGCFSLVLECVPTELGKQITDSLSIPTIGIGAGAHVDGQVLVLQDMLGMNNEFQPQFLRKYLKGYQLITDAVQSFHSDVQSGQFPSDKESYS